MHCLASIRIGFYKAYLTVENSAAQAIKFDFGTTAIEGVESATGVANSAIYDLAGRKVQNMTKGLYIVNGKKVIK